MNKSVEISEEDESLKNNTSLIDTLGFHTLLWRDLKEAQKSSQFGVLYVRGYFAPSVLINYTKILKVVAEAAGRKRNFTYKQKKGQK